MKRQEAGALLAPPRSGSRYFSVGLCKVIECLDWRVAANLLVYLRVSFQNEGMIELDRIEGTTESCRLNVLFVLLWKVGPLRVKSRRLNLNLAKES